jgi:thiopeptide-type bacteriocin biosynthesis protein
VTAARSRSWSADHVFISPGPMSDAFLVNVVAPFLKGLDGAGDWFFIRYGEGGPHLRIRVAIDHSDVAARIHRRWQEAAPIHVDAFARALVLGTGEMIEPGSVRAVAYEPEIARYGGARAMPLSEQLFCRSTALSLGVIAATLGDMEQRIGQAIGIMIASVRSLTDDPAEIGRLLSDYAEGWERWFAAVDWPAAIDTVPVTLRDPAAVEAALHAPIGPSVRSYGAAWHGCLAALIQTLEALDPPRPPAAGKADIVLSHLHMFCNRLGISPAMEFHLARAIGGIVQHPQRGAS